jgi:CheY-like chemotaxis protein
MSDPPRLRNERSPHDYLVCPRCQQPIRPGESAALQGGYAVHLHCEVTQEPERRPPAPATLPQQTILYIEDNEMNLRLVERLLEQRPGVRLLSADRARAGLDLARRHRPDAILLDIHLPDMEGTDLLPILREDPILARTPVIVLSAENEPQLPAQMLAAGAQAYLGKPLVFEEFFAAIDGALRGGEASAS